MKHTLFVLVLFGGFGQVIFAGQFESRTVTHAVDGKTFESTVVWKSGDEARPGILMVPNWMGPTESSLEKAKTVAAMGYVVMMADVYGVDVRPTSGKEAGAAAAVLRGDRDLMRARSGKALEVFLTQEGIPLDADKVAAIGFCFGGGTVLELARSGASLDAVISFHGDLASPTLESDSKNITAAVLVLHGAADPYVPQSDVSAFVTAMNLTSADWQLVQFANTVHSFTNPEANSPGASQYNAASSNRAFEYMEELLEEIWEIDND